MLRIWIQRIRIRIQTLIFSDQKVKKIYIKKIIYTGIYCEKIEILLVYLFY